MRDVFLGDPPSTRARRRRMPLLLLAAVAPAACSLNTRAPERTATMEWAGVDMNARVIRLSAQNLAYLYMSTVELSADSIMALSEDPAIDHAALEWKAQAIPAFQRAMYQTDPLVSFLDGWTLVVQMLEYYETGPGRDKFGPHQAVAVEGIRVVEEGIDSTLHANQPPDVYERVANVVYGWAEAYPLQDLYLRQSVGEIAVRELGEDRPQGLESLGTLTEFAWDAQQLGVMLATYLPKEARWQAELFLASLTEAGRISPVLAAVDSMAVMRAVTRLLERTPELIAAEREALFRAIAEERLAILENVEAQRIATLETAVTAINEERAAAIREIRGLVTGEREAVAGLVREGRVPLVEDTSTVIDHLVWRVAQVGAFLILLAGLVAYLVLRRWRSVRMEVARATST